MKNKPVGRKKSLRLSSMLKNIILPNTLCLGSQKNFFKQAETDLEISVEKILQKEILSLEKTDENVMKNIQAGKNLVVIHP